MKIQKLVLSAFLALSTSTAAFAQVPPVVNYQGRVLSGGINFNGAGQFKFALVGPAGTPTFWSNNGSSVNGSEPSAAVSLTVANGLYSVLLGDAAIPNMAAIPATVFGNPDVRLRVWFNDGVGGFQQLAPDQRVASVGYAMMSANVSDGVITGSKIANNSVTANKLVNGAITTDKIGDGQVTADKLAPGAITTTSLAPTNALGSSTVNGHLDVFRTSAGTPAVSLDGAESRISTFGSDGLEQIRLWGASWGEMTMNDRDGNNQTVFLTAGNEGLVFNPLGLDEGGLLDPGIIIPPFIFGYAPGLTLRSASGTNRVELLAESDGGSLELQDTAGRTRAHLKAEVAGGRLVLDNSVGTNTVELSGSGSQISTFGSDGKEQVRLWGTFYGEMLLNNSSVDNETAVRLSANSTSGGLLSLNDQDGNSRAFMQGANDGGLIQLRNASGIATVTLDANVAGEGRITTQVLQITGGSDLSENFEIESAQTEPEPGMIVCIDPDEPGRLVTSTRAFDRTVAGIISGAGGVKPGMLMGQAGTIADGKHPVALTGRVYCRVDADQGAIRAGDLITTSDTPGHGMKVTDPARATGAIIGKAMSSLDKGRGLVLVLVSLQ